MPDAQIIGKVAVKIVPSTTGFRGELKRQLDKIEASLPKIKVQVTVDDNRLKAEALRAVRKLNADIKGSDLYKVKLQTKITTDGMKGEIRRAARELSALASAERIDFSATVSNALAELQLSAKSLDKVADQLDRFRKDHSPLDIEVRPSLLAGAPAVVAGRLATLTRPRTVEIVPKLNAGATAGVATALAAMSGARVLNSVLDGLWSRLKNLDKAVPLIGSLASAIAGLGALSLGVAGNLFSLSSSLAQIGPATLALPGIFGGIAIGLGTFVAAIKDFNQIFPGFKDQLSSLQDSISSEFWAKAEAPMRRMIDTLFPIFSRELAKTGAELGAFFGKMSDSLRTVLGPALTGMFTDLHQSIEIASRYTQDFTNIIAVLGRVGAGYLPRLASAFGSIAERFSNWLSKVEASGQLGAWIDNGIFQFKELGRVIGNLGGIFRGLSFIAQAAGGATLTSIADTLQGVEDVVKGSTFQRVMGEMMTAAYDSISRVVNYAGPAFSRFMETLGETATRVFPIVGTVIGTAFRAIFNALNQPAVMDGLVAMFEGIQKAVEGLAPAMPSLALAFGALMGIVGDLAAVIGPILGVALQTLADIFVALAPSISEIIDLLGNGLLQVWQEVGPKLVALGEAVAKAFEDLIPSLVPLVEKFIELAITVMPQLIDALIVVLPPLTDLAVALADLAVALAPLAEGFALVATALFTSFASAVTTVAQFLTSVTEALGGVVTFVQGVFTGDWQMAWQGIAQVVTSMGGVIVGLIRTLFLSSILGIVRTGGQLILGAVTASMTAVRLFFVLAWTQMSAKAGEAMTSIKSKVSTGIDAVKAAISSGMDRAKQSLIDAFARIVTAAATGIARVIAEVSRLPGRIIGILSGLAGQMGGIGVQMMSGLIGGITSMAERVAGAARSVVSNAVSAAKSALGIKSPSRVFIEIGRYTGEGLALGIDRETASVRRAFEALVSVPDVNTPDIKSGSASASAASSVGSALDSEGAGVSKTFIYNAAPGSSISSEEDLFTASDSARMVGW